MPARTRRQSTSVRSAPHQHDEMHMQSLEDLFVKEIKDLYNAEQQILKALPKMIREVSSEELQQALRQHFDETKGHVERLDQVFADIGEAAGGAKCRGMAGILEEDSQMLRGPADESVKDAGIISAAQRVEHYEMAGC